MIGKETFELKVHARPENLARIAAFLEDVAERWGMGPKETFDVQMAVDEACTNIMEHGYGGDESGTIEISCRQTDEGVTITIRDFGHPFDPDAVPEPNIEAPLEERPVGGLGLFFMRQLMDDVRFQFDEVRGNVLTMTKRWKPVVVRTPAEARHVRLVAPRGRLDADLARELASTLEQLMADTHYRLVIDLRHTTYISSSGLRVLLVAVRKARAHGGDVKVFGLKSQVRKVFGMSGFDQIFPLFDTEKAAIEAFREAPHDQPADQTTP
jgi:anti-anti-sigma factor